MKIAIPARGLQIRIGGAREYIRNIIVSLVALDQVNEYYIYYSHPDQRLGFDSDRVHEIVIPWAPNVIWDHVLLPARMLHDRVDVTLFPKGTIPLIYPGRAVVTVFDLAYFFPGLRAYKPLDTLYRRVFMPLACRKADAVLAISHNTRHDICQMIRGVVPEKIHITYPAPAFQPSGRTVDVRRKFGLGEKPYIFFSASVSARKNIERVILAIDRIQDRIPHNFVLTGGKSWGTNRIREVLSQSGLEKRFYRLGFVDSDDLLALYAEADFYIMPSLYEGFSMTVVEAMMSGCPVAASDVSSHPEVVGDAGLMFDPYSVDEIARAILTLATDRELRARLREKGFVQARRFSWERCAGETLAVLEQVAQGGA